MIAKKYNHLLYTFEKSTGMSALFSNNELEQMKQYAASGTKSEFINRLFDLGILRNDCRDELTTAIEGIEIFSPQSIHIDITSRCPLNCPQCYKMPAEDYDMTITQFENIIRQANELKVFQIAIGGGEPLIHKDIVDFIKALSNTQMSSSITTSGYGLNTELLDHLQKAGLNHVQISLNGAVEEINALSRDGFDYGINAIKMLSETKISFGINFVARKDNIKNFELLVNLAKKHKADNINILRYKPSPAERYNDFCLDKSEFVLLVDKIKKVRGIKIKTDSAFSNLLIYANNGRVSKNACGCGAGKTFMSITAKGDFKPCSHMSLTSCTNSIKEYWGDSKDLHNLRRFAEYKNNEPDTCFSCRYFELCGGCRAICESGYNDIWAGEKDCVTYKRREIDV